jgi:hypothetical protein
MRIKKFYISYGGYSGGYEQFLKKGRDIFYYSEDRQITDLRDRIPEDAVRIRPEKREWKYFLESIKPFPTYWKKEYFAEVHDGIQWEVKIVTDNFTFKSHGSNAFPSDFEDFLNLVREFTNVREFGGRRVRRLRQEQSV